MSTQHPSPTSATDSPSAPGKNKATDRLFFCVFPDTGAGESIAAEADVLRIENNLNGVPLKPSHLHVTLHHLGDHAELRQDIVDKALAAAGRVSVPPFDITLSSACSLMGRGNSHPCVLLCPEERPPVYRLWRELSNQLMGVGLGRHLEREFTPHVTFLHDRQVLAPEAISPIQWNVRDFSLVHSLLGRGEYRALGSWKLR